MASVLNLFSIFFVLSYFSPASAGHVVGAVATHVLFTYQVIKCQLLILSTCITDGMVASAEGDTKSVLQLLKEQTGSFPLWQV